MSDDWILEKQSDPRSNQELITTALTRSDEDSDPGWEAIRVLQARGTQDIFDAARRLCESENPLEREVGVDILGQLGIPERTFPDESLEILLALLEREQETGLLESITVALGHLHDTRAIEPLAKLKNHPDSDVRHGLTFALGGHEDDLAISTLIELSSDESPLVRDWATFGLGSLIDTDSLEIRDALIARLADDDATTKGEALAGLAQRKDPRVVDALLKDLEGGWYGPLIFEAAAEIANPRLYTALMKIKSDIQDLSEYEKDLLEEAINNCSSA